MPYKILHRREYYTNRCHTTNKFSLNKFRILKFLEYETDIFGQPNKGQGREIRRDHKGKSTRPYARIVVTQHGSQGRRRPLLRPATATPQAGRPDAHISCGLWQ